MEICVSPTGNDGNSGSGRSPVRSFERALTLLRESSDSVRKLLVLDGDYFDVNICLDHRDSGLSIEAAPGSGPRLFGGVLAPEPIVQNGLWVFDLSGLPLATYGVRHLVLDGKPVPRSRYPEEGYFYHDNSYPVRWLSATEGGWERSPTTAEKTTLKYRGQDLGDWLDLVNTEIRVYHQWDESILRIAAVDPRKSELTFASSGGYPPGAFIEHAGDQARRYILFNTRQGLDRSGTWFYDHSKKQLLFHPPENLNPDNANFIIPTREMVIAISGSESDPVQDISIRGLNFSSTTAPCGAMGFGAAGLPGGIHLKGYMSGLQLTDLEFSGMGGKGISSSVSETDFRDILVRNCCFLHCGGGGLELNGKRIRIETCSFREIGADYPSGVALCCRGLNNQISGNVIDGCSYTAIVGGGTACIAEKNRIRNFMQELNDGGAIYFFKGTECIYKENQVIGCGRKRIASAYYLDELSSGCIVENNVSVNAAWAANNHMAVGNVIRNNLFLSDTDLLLNFARCKEYVIESNVIAARGEVVFGSLQDPTFARVQGNLIHSGSGRILASRAEADGYGCASSSQWQPDGNVFLDPGFKISESEVSCRDLRPESDGKTVVIPLDVDGTPEG